MLQLKKLWEDKGYEVSYINFDSANSYNNEIIDCPTSIDQIKTMFGIMEQYAKDNDIIIIDSLKSFSSYYELIIENNDEMYNLMIKLRTIIKKTHCSFILVHHIYRPKNLKSRIDNFYGARAIEEQCDSGFIYYGDNVTIIKSRLGYQRDDKITI